MSAKSIETLLKTGLPRPRYDNMPFPWTAIADADRVSLAGLDVNRQYRCHKEDLCGVCGEELDDVRIVFTDTHRIILDGIGMHPLCAQITATHCKGLKPSSDAKTSFTPSLQYTINKEQHEACMASKAKQLPFELPSDGNLVEDAKLAQQKRMLLIKCPVPKAALENNQKRCPVSH